VAVQRHASIAFARHQLLVIGTHGLAPTVWLAALMPLRPTAASFGASLTFPDVIDVDLVAKRAERRNVSIDHEATPGTHTAVMPAGSQA